MKKFFLTLALVATSVVAWADRWTPPSSNAYPDETPLYVKVVIDENANGYVPQVTEIAAFINGECRAQATQMSEATGFYTLRVRGGQADQSKTITFKAVYNGLVYQFNRTETFDGEAQTHDVPLTLTLQPLLGISLDADPITLSLGTTYNLASHISYQYGVSGGNATSSIDQTETPLSVYYSLSGQSASGFITVDSETGIITPQKPTGANDYVAVQVAVSGPVADAAYFQTSSQVIVTYAPVTSIVVNPTELTVYVGDNINDLIAAGTLDIHMLPVEANQAYRIDVTTPVSPYDAEGYFTTTGDFELNVYSVDNAELSPVTLTIHVKEHLAFTLEREAYIPEIGMIQPKTFNIYMNTPDDFDASKLTIGNNSNLPIAPFTYEISALQREPDAGGVVGRYYVTVTMMGRYVGEVNYTILYNGDPIDVDYPQYTAIICPEIRISRGWQWVSPYAYQEGEAGDIYSNSQYISWVNDLVEMRTQEGLLYVDQTLGAFGDITEFNFTRGMYKVKGKDATVLRLGSNQATWRLARENDGNDIRKGYNWVVYPYEFALTLDEASSRLLDFAQEGDQIISKDGTFAEFSNGQWINNGFTFQPGAGYMYYYTGTNNARFEVFFNIYEKVPQCYTESNGVKGEMGSNVREMEPVWEVNRSNFADNMTVVAEVDGLTDVDEWVLGAFVGSECRGEGRAVRDGIMFIGIAGKNGEKMSFRLHNTRTGEEFDITESLKFQQKAGSLKAPLRLTSEGATGISEIVNSKSSDSKSIYDLSGRRIMTPTKGIYVVNGKKVVY